METSGADISSDAKKIKLKAAEPPNNQTPPLPTDVPVTKEPDVKSERPSLKIICSLAELFQKRSAKFTRKQLEEFCLEKLCEALAHKSEVGELRHQLSAQDQMIEQWKKEITALQKQARDLETVNRRLLYEIRQKNDKNKPLVSSKNNTYGFSLIVLFMSLLFFIFQNSCFNYA